MALFNSLYVELPCPGCGTTTCREIQYRYGHMWQHRYELGDTIIWGPAAVGDPTAHDVVVDGWLSECPDCDHEEDRIAVYVRDGVLDAVGPVGEVPNLPQTEWMVLPEQPGVPG
ncbi:hypothetical protein [Antribacter gilvus]|uniref:hypothetical protein n=1 Tax=Antribacter gilvus TaxID=2304675 RepID=UPI000F78E572|nr:hypothetical protein [Antribacter gilvus]